MIFIGFAAILLITQGASISVWCISYFLALGLILQFYVLSVPAIVLLTLIGICLLGLSFKALRIALISKFLFKLVSKNTPKMSSTEREALEAGTISWEGDLFAGSPDFSRLLDHPPVNFSHDEQQFIAGPLQVLCRMIDDWDITHTRSDMSPELWQFLKDNRFFGMIIPKNYGGLGFSATAQAAILATVYGRSISVATTISVPNSLGPAELLLKYGTEQQKEYYLPRLADGQEIPCFALTGPTAGSDAASIPDTGIVCKEHDVIGIRLNWNKRYITLCPVATIIGLAFRLVDPENLLGKGIERGITCALIPANTTGVTHGRRHFPLNTAFLNGPTQGKDVFIPLDYLIGGAAMAGKGWRMLMECLSAGRAISLPSSAMGGSQAAALASGAYARVRTQFNQSIAKFEGIEEPLARIAANTYIIDAGLTLAASAIDRGAKPAVAGAILKYHTTERARQVAMDAMDIHGGKGICLGPKNYLGRGYQTAPVSITVEGANILTRSLIIFGQGAIRCHPYVYQELESIRNQDLTQFDTVFWSHVSFVLANTVKSFGYSLTGARFKSAPTSTLSYYFKQISRYSNYLAFLADFCMITLGDKLKRKEKISARLGDMLSSLYLASAVLKRFHDEGQQADDQLIAEWACQQLLYECDAAMNAIIQNTSNIFSRLFLTLILKPFGNMRHRPSDILGQALANLLTRPNKTRDRLTRFVFTEDIPTCPIGQLERAFHTVILAEPLERKINQAVKEKIITGITFSDKISCAFANNIINQEELIRLKDAEKARLEIIAVDDFAAEELSAGKKPTRRPKAKTANRLE